MKKRRLISSMNLLWTFVVLSLSLPTLSFAQTGNVDIKGNIKDSQGAPLIGVTIRIKGTNSGTQSVIEGEYKITAPSDATLEFSMIGFATQDIAIDGKTVINVKMVETNQSLSQLVVIGYGEQRKSDVTSAVTTIQSKDFVSGPVTDAAELLKGKVAGLSISNPSGDPNAQSNIMLRGINTIGGANTSPLVIVDGVPGDLLTVAPEDIASISVLKDASATAIYGVRGSNGVIIITTKHATGNVNQVDFNSSVSFGSITRQPKLLTAQDYRNQIAAGTRDPSYDIGSSTDWLDALEKKFPVSATSNLTFRGGNSTTNYLASINYRALNGIFLRSNHHQFTGRVDINHSMLDGKLKFNLGMTQTQFNGLPFNSYNWESAIKMDPTAPVKLPDGSYYEQPTNFEYQNPINDIMNSDQPQKSSRAKYNATITILPVEGLRLSATGSYQKSNYLNNYFANFQTISTIRDAQNGVARTNSGQSIDRYLNISGQYSRSFGDNHLSLLAGYEYQDDNSFSSSIANHDFPSDLPTFGFNDIGIGAAQKNGLDAIRSGHSENNLISYFARINYNYKDRYLLLASYRIDGASQLYGSREPYGKFPSIQAGWRITNESFMKNQHVFDQLKLRVGYGVTGNPPGRSFLGPALLGYGNYTLYNGTWIQTLGPSQNPNPDLRWEEKHETNIGLDYSLLNGMISGTIDVYNNKTKGLLYNYTVPSPPNLYPNTEANVGTLANKGIEVSVNVIPVKHKDFQWTSGVTFSTNSNKLESLSNDLYKASVDYFTTGYTIDPIQTFTHIVKVGQPIGDFYGYKVVGVSDQGTWIYKEPNGKTVPYSEFNHSFEDKQVIGNGLPKYYASWNNTITYKNWDLGITMRGAFGFQVLNSLRMNYESTGVPNYNRLASSKDKVFGTAILSKTMPQEFNSYYVENGDFWKIDNINIGYTFRNLKSKYIKHPRIYLSSLNTWVFTGYKGTDPEVPVTGSAALSPGVEPRDEYPSIRTITLGFSASF